MDHASEYHRLITRDAGQPVEASAGLTDSGEATRFEGTSGFRRNVALEKEGKVMAMLL
jgi:hypothetical protein